MLKLVVFCCVVAMASAAVVAPFGYPAPLAYTPLAYTAPLGWAGSNYRGPLSLAPGQPANVLAADGRPLDTLDVNLDRSAHIVAKAFSGHLLKKRSVVAPVVAPVAPLATRLTLAHAPLIAPTHFGHVAAVGHVGAVAPYSAYTTFW